MHSAIYEGTVRHRRFRERSHEFTHRIAMAYVDLEELERLNGGRLVRSGPGLVRFRRADYLGDPAVGLADAVRARVAEEHGTAPEGPVRVLTQLRTLGHCFNPVSFYYLFAPGGECLEAIVAEVTSTPWGERHAYVLGRDSASPGRNHVPTPDGSPAMGVLGRDTDGSILRGGFEKQLHVSPFMDMDQRYAWSAPAPGPTLSVHIASAQDGVTAFDATLGLRRRPFTRRVMAEVTVRHPAATLRLLALIYGHAVALKAKGVRIKPKPKTQPQGQPS